MFLALTFRYAYYFSSSSEPTATDPNVGSKSLFMRFFEGESGLT
jgi:hypothetical protein